jgi:hypothetical protein
MALIVVEASLTQEDHGRHSELVGKPLGGNSARVQELSIAQIRPHLQGLSMS